MNSKQVYHLWANQSQTSAKSGNVSFCRTSAYSYSALIAQIYPELQIILMCERDYSITTSKHKSYIRSSIDYSKYSLIEVPNNWFKLKEKTDYAKNKHLENVVYLENEIIDLHKKLKTSRKYKDTIAANILEKNKNYTLYCNTFKVKIKKSIIDFNMETYKAEIEAQKVKNAKAEVIKKQKELNFFFNGDENLKTVIYRNSTNYAKITGETVKTDKGAEISLKELKYLVKAIENNAKLENIGLGNFTINYFSEAGMKIGCHYFDTIEINRIINLLGAK